MYSDATSAITPWYLESGWISFVPYKLSNLRPCALSEERKPSGERDRMNGATQIEMDARNMTSCRAHYARTIRTTVELYPVHSRKAIDPRYYYQTSQAMSYYLCSHWALSLSLKFQDRQISALFHLSYTVNLAYITTNRYTSS